MTVTDEIPDHVLEYAAKKVGVTPETFREKMDEEGGA